MQTGSDAAVHTYLLQSGKKIVPQINFAKYKIDKIKIFTSKPLMPAFEVKLSEFFIISLVA